MRKDASGTDSGYSETERPECGRAHSSGEGIVPSQI